MPLSPKTLLSPKNPKTPISPTSPSSGGFFRERIEDRRHHLQRKTNLLHTYEEEIHLTRQKIKEQNEQIQRLKKLEEQHRKDHSGLGTPAKQQNRAIKQIEILEQTLLRVQSKLSESHQRSVQLRRKTTDLDQTLRMLRADSNQCQRAFGELQQDASKLRTAVRNEKTAKDVAVAENNSLLARFNREKELWKAEIRNSRMSVPQKSTGISATDISARLESGLGNRYPKSARGVVTPPTIALSMRNPRIAHIATPKRSARRMRQFKLQNADRPTSRRELSGTRRAENSQISHLLSLLASTEAVNPGLISFVDQLSSEHLGLSKKLGVFTENINRLRMQSAGDINDGRRILQKLENKLKVKQRNYAQLKHRTRELTDASAEGFNATLSILALLESVQFNSAERSVVIAPQSKNLHTPTLAFRRLPRTNGLARPPNKDAFRNALGQLERNVLEIIDFLKEREPRTNVFPGQFARLSNSNSPLGFTDALIDMCSSSSSKDLK
eukprot:gnl/Chilomastix_cuspidata/2355.p1 GENE.gnl/Chilomastix_cuspidata/2355~~gnl/Chilomastix_cuspidata/2355.p1  ORF type:complete len:542 (-),score=147.38 gnl/Chilomastix_cuspidata/2355:120-1613(-)